MAEPPDVSRNQLTLFVTANDKPLICITVFGIQWIQSALFIDSPDSSEMSLAHID